MGRRRRGWSDITITDQFCGAGGSTQGANAIGLRVCRFKPGDVVIQRMTGRRRVVKQLYRFHRDRDPRYDAHMTIDLVFVDGGNTSSGMEHESSYCTPAEYAEWLQLEANRAKRALEEAKP